LCLSLTAFLAAASSSSATQEFRIATRTVEVPEAGFLTNTVLVTSRHELAFQPPKLWKMAADAAARQLTWEAPDRASLVRVRLHEDAGGQKPTLSPEQARARVSQPFAGARVVEEFVCHTGAGEGRAVELERVDGPFRTSIRCAWVPVNGGLLEIHCISPADALAARQPDFTQFFNSLRVAERANASGSQSWWLGAPAGDKTK
jgi:hypothetical protein